MNAQIARPAKKINGFLVAVFGLAAVLVVGGVAAGVSQSLGISDRTAVLILALIGLTMCALGPLGRGAEVGWAHPLHILGYLLGAAALYVAGAVLFGWSLPWIASDRMALFALAGLMLVKVLVGFLYPRRA